VLSEDKRPNALWTAILSAIQEDGISPIPYLWPCLHPLCFVGLIKTPTKFGITIMELLITKRVTDVIAQPV
jgi:hypothetical protein